MADIRPTFQIQPSNMSQSYIQRAHMQSQVPTRAPPSLRLKSLKSSPKKVSSGTSPMSKSPEKEKVSKSTSPKFAGIHRSDADIQDLCCPITLEFMEDPVVASDGKTYERAALLKSVADSDIPTSPLTNETLLTYDDGELILFDNENLKHIIIGWQHGHFRDAACPEGSRFMDNNEKELRNIMIRLKINDDDEEKKQHFFQHVARYKPKKTRKRMSIFGAKRRGGTRRKKR